MRLPDLLIDLELSRNDGTYKKIMAKYSNPVLLIIDEWLLLKPSESEQKDISMREVYGIDKALAQ